MSGDFNCCLNATDMSTKTHLTDKSCKVLQILITKFNLNDVWSSKNITTIGSGYTWQDHVTQSRLDYFLVSKKCNINLTKISNIIVITNELRYTADRSQSNNSELIYSCTDQDIVN